MPTVEEIQTEVVKSNEAVNLRLAEIKKELDKNTAELEAMKARGERPEASAEHGKKMTELEKSLDDNLKAIAEAQKELVAVKGDLTKRWEQMDELQKAMQRGDGMPGGDGDAYKTAGQRLLEVMESQRDAFAAYGGNGGIKADSLPMLAMKSFGNEPAFLGVPAAEVRKALGTTAAGNLIPPHYVPGYMPLTRRSLRIRDLIPVVPIDRNRIVYIRQKGFTGTTPSAVTSITQTGGLATITQTAHGYDDHDRILIAGANQAGYNIAGYIKVLTANTYTMAVASGTVSPATGTITALRMNNYGSSDFVAEGTTKPEAQMFFEERTANVQTIANYMKMTRQLDADMPGLRQGVDSDLIYGVLRKEDIALLYATGAGSQISGLLTDPDIQAYKWSTGTHGDTKTDAIRRSRTLLELADFEASGVIIHPTVWEQIELEKSTTGEYIWVDSESSMAGLNPYAAGQSLWRMPLVVTRAIKADTWLAGDFARAATIYDREQANVRFSDQNEADFINNLVTVLAEERLGLAVRRPEAFVAGTFDTAPA